MASNILAINKNDLSVNEFILKRRLQWMWFLLFNHIKTRLGLEKFFNVDLIFFRVIKWCFGLQIGLLRFIECFLRMFLYQKKLRIKTRTQFSMVKFVAKNNMSIVIILISYWMSDTSSVYFLQKMLEVRVWPLVHKHFFVI